MFGLGEAKCPLETGEKMWIESRMRWLAGKLGLDRLVDSEVILPHPRFFPDPYSATHADARRMFERVCGYMKLDPLRFDLEVYPDDSMPGAAGLYYQGQRPRIALANTQLADPERLIATIAHELAHDILLGGGLISRDESDHEPVTDLVPVFLGLGVFTANAPVRDRTYTQNNWHYFKIDKQGYLPSRMVGYALALFAYARREAKPAWARYLRPDAADPLKRGLRYLLKTSDTFFHPDTAHEPVTPPTEAETRERLATDSPTIRAMTLRAVSAQKLPPIALLDAVICQLGDRDTDVQIEAARVLLTFGEAAGPAVPELIACLASESGKLRACAAAALATAGCPSVQIVPELTRLLLDPAPVVVDTAADGLRRLGPSASPAVPALVEAIRMKEVDCVSSDAVADALAAIDPRADILKALLDPIDREIRERVIRSLRAARFRPKCDPPASPEPDFS